MVGLGLASVLALVWLLLPPTGSDLSAQVAHADFAGAHPWSPVDLQWFGGTSLLGYSVIVPPLMAALRWWSCLARPRQSSQRVCSGC